MAQHITQLNKYISEHQKITRRAADRLIEENQVLINGRFAKGSDKVFFGDQIKVAGKLLPLYQPEETTVLAFNKPLNLDGSAAPKAMEILTKLISLKTEVYPIGRLGVEAKGLLLLTNDEVLASSFNKKLVSKTYSVVVEKTISAQFLEKLQAGVEVLGKKTETCKAVKTNDNTIEITLKDEINKQVAAMCEGLGNKALEIKRINVAGIALDALGESLTRDLSTQEIETLKKNIAESADKQLPPEAKVKPKPKVVAVPVPKTRAFNPEESPKKSIKPEAKKPTKAQAGDNWFVAGPPKKKRKF